MTPRPPYFAVITGLSERNTYYAHLMRLTPIGNYIGRIWRRNSRRWTLETQIRPGRVVRVATAEDARRYKVPVMEKENAR